MKTLTETNLSKLPASSSSSPVLTGSRYSGPGSETDPEELARRTFILLQEADIGSRRRPPSLYAVFQLYCVKEWTIPQIARKCRCSLGTVANRLEMLRRQVGLPPTSLRRISSHFTVLDRDFRQARRNYNRRRPAYLQDDEEDYKAGGRNPEDEET